ncbi:MAG: response regulator receiver [Puniceicoccaceae bacterium 5H]|nr:MAG: response regulator receiver [Puniceicoccaceae bacterium 5H]
MTDTADSPTAKTRLYFIEDEALLCDLFAEYVKTMPEIDYLGYSQDGAEAMRRCLELEPDMVIVDIRMPEVNGLEILTLLHRKLPETKIILFTGTVDNESLRLAVRYGADGYVEKTYGLEELRKAIQIVLGGEKHYSPGIAKLLRNFKV